MKPKVKKIKVILSGGGTGGHIFPALSIAKELEKQNPNIKPYFIGALGKMEMGIIPANGYKIYGLPISGFQRKLFTFKNFLLPLKILISFIYSIFLLAKIKPRFLIGTGGYASAVFIRTAALFGKSIYIQEQNAFPGITNKILAPFSKKVFTAYSEAENFFDAKKCTLLGNPIRIRDYHPPTKKNHNFEILVLGGSLGAQMINQAVSQQYPKWIALGCNVTWQTGGIYFDKYKNLKNEKVYITEFITDMYTAFQQADLIISRAGAGTISELAIIGKPTILIPSPNVAENHQLKNAQALAKSNAAILLEENHIDLLSDKIEKLIQNKEIQKILSENIAKFSYPNAAEDIAKSIITSEKIC